MVSRTTPHHHPRIRGIVERNQHAYCSHGSPPPKKKKGWVKIKKDSRFCLTSVCLPTGIQTKRKMILFTLFNCFFFAPFNNYRRWRQRVCMTWWWTKRKGTFWKLFSSPFLDLPALVKVAGDGEREGWREGRRIILLVRRKGPWVGRLSVWGLRSCLDMWANVCICLLWLRAR